ncbi:AAA family ATPase [Pedococcus dokdonensis]|uniref:AAA family ATPase n=1 Tax=Pedococcus dokdonensis TaxID=443156 RepID=UPI000B817F64|nr:LuxR family transcriptional regulator [Pedococcus dokdonensis]
MELVEREPQLEQLRTALQRSHDQGCVVAVAGEAGAGKSALVRVATTGQQWTRVARGLCDPLETPRPLGPVRDLLADLGAPVGADAGSPVPVAERLIEAVGTEPTTFVIEDAQWVDEASVEVLRFLARRVETLPLVVLLTYRDGEIGPDHALRPLLGDLARLEAGRTIVLQGLSIGAIRTVLDGTGIDAPSVLALTAGNPFFVTEIARHPTEALPASVRDAVLASTSAVDAADLEALQVIATAPDSLDDRLLPALEIDVPQLRRLEATGLLVRSRRGVGFRHELARRAVEDSIPAGVAASLHTRMLDALEELAADPAVLAHHAHAAGDHERTRRFADRAAAEAGQAGSHREAAAFLELALAHPGGDPGERAALLERLSFQQYMVSRLPDAVDSITEAARLWAEARDDDGVAAAHSRRALVEYYSARRAAAERHIGLALDHRDAPAYGAARSLEMLLAFRRNDAEATALGRVETRTLAVERADDELLVRSEILGTAGDVLMGDDPAARERLLTLVHDAAARLFDETASTGWSQLAAIDVEQRRFRDAESLLSHSLPFTVDRDIPICEQWQTGVRSRLQFERGHWEAGLEDARTVLDGGAPIASLWPHLVAALVTVRRGEPEGDDGSEHLAHAVALADLMDEPLARLAVMAALAERAWLLDVDDPRLADAGRLLDEVGGLPGVQWSTGRLAVWLQRLGGEHAPAALAAGTVAEPSALELAGRFDEAAARWTELGAPYEAALARIGSSDEQVAVAAVSDLETMGAWAAAERARGALRQRGVSRVPARRRATTVANPSGLTSRQLDVARLVALGLTNAELAQKLFISPRTADHHVSAVLTKLGLGTRREVVRRATELGLV